MTKSLNAISAIALLSWAMPLAAQEAAPEEPATDAPAAEAPATEAPAAEAPAEGEVPAEGEEAAPGSSLDMGAEIGGATTGEPQEGQPYVREEFGDWSLVCARVTDGPEPCQLAQVLANEDGNAVAEIRMFPLPAGGPAAAGAEIVVPLETLLTENIRISIDGGATKVYPIRFCVRAGCVAQVGFTPEELDQFKRGNAATLSIVPARAPDQTFDLSISLTGFTAGIEASTVPPTPAEGAAQGEAAPAEGEAAPSE